MLISPKKRRFFVSKVLGWGHNNIRDFPWRRTTNAFHVLIAELMLQRTNADQVEPVYKKFIAQYSSPQDVAKTPLGDIAKSLQSLGLAYRAHRLKRISDMIVEKFGSMVPRNEDALLQLPGVGKYIANAVRCFAFNMDAPLVDTNILRVMKRVFSITTSEESHKDLEIWSLVTSIIPKQKAREFNLSILDFASLVCTARNPIHGACPLKGICDFYARTNPL